MDEISPAPYRLPYAFAKANHIVLLYNEEQANCELLCVKLPSPNALTEIVRCFGPNFDVKSVTESIFQKSLARCYQSQSAILEATEGMADDMDLGSLAHQLPSSEDLLDTQDDAPIIRLINALFTQAIKQKASDIHIETYENRVLIRNRIDGVLNEVLEIQREIAPLVISRVKVMARLDIAEKRIPQDGRINLKIGGHAIDVRVSTLPSNHGERIVMRILDKNTAQLDLALLGMPQDTLLSMRKLIAEPHGIILVTGPTGSGKTTSLYAMLTELNQVTRNILTIEDPIEYDLPGIGQSQVNAKVNMTFSKGLRAILRQDPDVVMIGEIRDLETADIAIQSSLTGHLVLSTLHTNTALGAIARLKDMGVESFLLSSSLVGLIAQRLVRTLCTQCKQAYTPTAQERNIMGMKEAKSSKLQLYKPLGCNACNDLGYHGRTGIYELIEMNDELRGMIHRNESIQVIEESIRKNTPSIRTDGFKRVLAGDTSLAEILRVTSQQV